MEFAKKLRTYMGRSRLSQQVMGDAVGVSQNQVSRWLRGVNTPDVRQAATIAGVLGLPLDHLLDDDQPLYTEHEVELLREVRRLIAALGVEEAWRRLVGAQSPAPARVVEGRSVYPPGSDNSQKKDVG
jgi:transcriptional regulator with XRE-family HTH domain